MKGLAVFDRDKLKWQLLDVCLASDFFKDAKVFKRLLSELGRSKFIHILDVELDSFEITGANTFNWSTKELPKTPTIEECIKQNITELNRVKAILFN